MNPSDPCGHHHDSGCQCCGAGGLARLRGPLGTLSRRGFLSGATATGVSTMVFSSLSLQALRADTGRAAAPQGRPLRIQPALVYQVPARREGTSWRSWGSIQTEEQAQEEKARIEGELQQMKAGAGFPLELLPVAMVKTTAEAEALAKGDHDGVLIYAAGGWVDTLEALANPAKWNIMFLRHRSGPVYLWYEIAHNRFLRKTVDQFGQPGMGVDDVVVDDHQDVLWRLRALHGLKRILGRRVLTIGGASGWGEGGRTAPERARDLWKLDLVDISYPDLGKLIDEANRDAALVAGCRQAADAYLAGQAVSLETDRAFVDRAFVLTEVFRRAMDAAGTDVVTINACMGTIMEVSKTTACLPLSLLNDEGRLAFCESDFVVIPSGILLQAISGTPVFLNDPTWPHHGQVTLAHCTAPRRMGGKEPEPVRVLTHFESDYGAAPKVEMRKGQLVTNLVPDFASTKWVGFEGEIIDNPFLDICRSQVDVAIHGDAARLLREMGGFHWMTCYGNHLREVGYALAKVGVQFIDLSRQPAAEA